MPRFLVLLFILSSSCLALPNNITIVTEQLPPYNYQEDGVMKGMSTEVLQAVLQELNLEVSIEVYPWARAYRMAKSNENVLIYSISRIPQREELFKWVGVIAPVSFGVFALKKRPDIKATSLDELRPYRLATVLGSAVDQYFTKEGFTNIVKSNSTEVLMKMFLLGRSDVWPVSKQTGIYALKKAGISPSETVREILKLKDFSSGNQYMAFSYSTKDHIVNQFRKALQKIKQKGIYQNIIEQYEN